MKKISLKEAYMVPLAKQLPRNKVCPRYVKVGQAIADCVPDSRDHAVRLTRRCWISTARWNEIAFSSDTLQNAHLTAIAESRIARTRGKSQYAEICIRLDAIENPGFQSRRTTLAIHAINEEIIG